MVWMCFIVIEPFVKFRKDRVEDVRVLPQRNPNILRSSVLSEFVNMKRVDGGWTLRSNLIRNIKRR